MMGDDLVKRLRFGSLTTMGSHRMNLEAADEITRLREQLSEARLSELAALGQAQDAYTAQKQAEADKLAAMERFRKKVITIIDLLSLGRSHSAHKAMVQAIKDLDLDALAEGDK